MVQWKHVPVLLAIGLGSEGEACSQRQASLALGPLGAPLASS